MTILVPQLTLMVIVYLIVFFTCYPIEAMILLFMSGPPGLLYAWVAVLQQSSVVSLFLVKAFLLPEIQRVAFDAVLTREYADDVVLLGRLRRVVKVPYYIQFMDTLWYLPSMLILPYNILRTIVLFGVSSIPMLGPCIAIFLQAPSSGLRSHSRYFVLKGLDFRQVSAIYKANSGAYMGFGITSTLLEQIPILSVFFMFTNTIGASLWAVNIEHNLKNTPIHDAQPEKLFVPVLQPVELNDQNEVEPEDHPTSIPL